MKYKVTLYNQHAQCGIGGKPARSKRKAYENAVNNARREFMTYGHDFYALGNELFVSAAKAMQCSKTCPRASCASPKGFCVEIERIVPDASEMIHDLNRELERIKEGKE